MIDFGAVYHAGLLVANMEQAQQFYTQSLGIEWAPIHIYSPLTLWTPDQGMREFPLRVCYSRSGPLHLELLEASPGTFYDTATIADAKHIGLFVDDVGGEVDRLTALGWTVIAARATPEERYGRMAYMLAPEGRMVIELISNAIKPMLFAWFEEEDASTPRYV